MSGRSTATYTQSGRVPGDVDLATSANSDDPYLEFLRARTGKIFYRLPYPGNAGDSLIQFATQMILEDMGIRTTLDPREAEVILSPGGNPGGWPDIGIDRWQALWQRYPNAEFVVGPSGLTTDRADWSNIVNIRGTSVSALFARDPESFETLRSGGLRADITIALSHDPALYLRSSQWLRDHRAAASEEYILASFRDDREASDQCYSVFDIPRNLLPRRVYNWHVKRKAGLVRERKVARAASKATAAVPLNTVDVSRHRMELFVEIIRAAREVHTDRLHVALLAAMLGKKVHAYQAARDKLERVYRHSLAEWADVELVRM
jgi:exopolysaccharide biosynthesis predicted pyruvyltransferase EpsI